MKKKLATIFARLAEKLSPSVFRTYQQSNDREIKKVGLNIVIPKSHVKKFCKNSNMTMSDAKPYLIKDTKEYIKKCIFKALEDNQHIEYSERVSANGEISVLGVLYIYPLIDSEEINEKENGVENN